MATSNSLFDLVHAMDKGERKSFRLLANYYSPEKKNHLFLFDLIARMDQYDSGLLQEKLTQAGIRTPLLALSTYLQEQILKSLRYSYSDKSVDDRITDLITNAKLLHHKGLEKLSQSNIQRAKKLALENEKFTLLLEIQNIEWFYLYDFDPKDISDFGDTLQKLTTIYNFRKASFEKTKLLGKGEIRDEKLKQEWEELIGNPIFDAKMELQYYEEKYHYLQILTRYYSRNKIYDQSLYYQQKTVEHLESNKELLKGYKETYMFELNGMVVVYGQNKKFDLADEALAKLIKLSSEQLSKSELTRQVDTVIIAYANLIHFYFIENHFQKATVLSDQAKKFIEIYPVTKVHKAFLYLNFSKISIYNGDYFEALKWNNKILNAETKERRDDYYTLSKLFNLIIHFELKNLELIQSITRSTAIFLEKRSQLYKTEATILKYLKKKFPKTTTNRETMNLFKMMLDELAEIRKDPFEAKAYDYFDYIVWLESKIKRKSLIEIAMA